MLEGEVTAAWEAEQAGYNLYFSWDMWAQYYYHSKHSSSLEFLLAVHFPLAKTRQSLKPAFTDKIY